MCVRVCIVEKQLFHKKIRRAEFFVKKKEMLMTVFGLPSPYDDSNGTRCLRCREQKDNRGPQYACGLNLASHSVWEN